MTLPNADETLLRRYLLGTVSPESREGLEGRLFSDDRLFWERISIAEDELVSDYVQQALSADERRDFENHFLCTDERRAKLEFAKALQTYVEQPQPIPEPRPGWFSRRVMMPASALAAAAALLLAVYVFPGFQRRTGDGTKSGVVAVTLPSGLTRAAGGELTRVRLDANTRVAQLQLDPGSATSFGFQPGGNPPYASYRATVYHVDGDEFIAEMKVASTPSGLTLLLPANLLAEGDYYVRLQGISPNAEPVQLNRYDFRVLRQ